jgi:predicted RNA-binding Zn-ribbon protein involved in translation (DUF1610 family)
MPLRAIEASPRRGGLFVLGCISYKEASMFQRENNVRAYTCPNCGNKLTGDRDLLRCEDHGAFFAYGPQLLVRAPRENGKHHETLMPWENHKSVKNR